MGERRKGAQESKSEAEIGVTGEGGGIICSPNALPSPR